MKHTAHVVVRDENGQQVWAGMADVNNGRIEVPVLDAGQNGNTADATGAGASSSSASSSASSPTMARLRGEQ